MPEIRPFRGLRFDAESVGDLAAVVAPPYDVVGPAERERLLARHERNVIRLDLPTAEPREEPDERYRRAARKLAAWRSDGTLRKDPRPSIYAYEQIYRVPGSDLERTQRGFFGRLRLEHFGPDSGVRPHEQTLEGPREDRYRLLRATGVNTSPVVGLYEDPTGPSAAALATVAARPPDVDVVDDDGVRHRLWVVPAEDDAPAQELIGAAGRGAVTIADGHHRYETALRYRDERRMSRSCEEDPAFDYLLTLFLEATSQPLTVLPTHRVVLGLGADAAAGIRTGLDGLFDVRPADRSEIEATFGSGKEGGGAGRLGLWTRAGGSVLTARRGAFIAAGPAAGREVRQLDVWLLGVTLERACGLDAGEVAAGGRLRYVKSASEAIDLVNACSDGADAAFLLQPTPVASITAVAAAGEVMPQKSTYFYPKALTGLVINPHEW